MIRVVFQCTMKGQIIAFRCQGHSGFAAAGQDIVCAAVSVLMQSAVLSLTTLYHPPAQNQMRRGQLSCQLPQYGGSADAETQAIMRHTLLGIANMALAYPKRVELSVAGVSDATNLSLLFSPDMQPEALTKILEVVHIVAT